MSSMMDPVVLPARPQTLPISKTCIYKTVPNGKSYISIPVDVYLPSGEEITAHGDDACPILLYIHGGGWIGGNRSDYSRPLFLDFLALGFVVASMDYRLLPETSFEGQQGDIKDIEPWLRQQLPIELEDAGLRCDTDKIIVAGGSAGAHLALLTPKLWQTMPTAILSLYGPTNFHSLPWLGRGRIARMPCAPCTPELLDEATDYRNPPTEIALPATEKDYRRPRQFISLTFFRDAIVSEFLLRGLVKGEDGTAALPQKGSVSVEEIDDISPLHLCSRYQFPPVYQAIGTSDEIFSVNHIHEFHAALRAQGIPTEKIIIPGAVHAFDVREEVGSQVHHRILTPAVAWVAQWAGRGGG